jgi:hypothetical protein
MRLAGVDPARRRERGGRDARASSAVVLAANEPAERHVKCPRQRRQDAFVDRFAGFKPADRWSRHVSVRR